MTKAKRFPEDVMVGDLIIPTQEGIEFYGLDNPTKVRAAFRIRVSSGDYYTFSVTARRQARGRAADLGSVWFTGFYEDKTP